MPTQLTARAVSKSFLGRPVLDEVTCAFATGERTGIIGENGSGKSTLLRLLAGRERPDSGEITVRAGGGVGYLAQDEELPPHYTVRQIIDRALVDLRTIEHRLRTLEAEMADGAGMAEYAELTTLFEARGGYDAEAGMERAMHGLGLGLVARDRTVGSLSGGEQVRLRLASVLAAGTEVLLLDEPTNHLDDDAITWLEDHLRARRGTVVTVSHDRRFLERVATDLLEVDADRKQVLRYGNGYAGYLAEKAAARQRWAQAHQQWQTDIARLRETAATTARAVAPGRAMKDNNKMAYDRAGGRVQQSLASRVRNAEERLRRLLADPVPAPPQPLRFTPVLRAGRVRGPVLEAVEVAVAGRLHRMSLSLAAGERVLVTGPNGAGKSTLIGVLTGEVAPDSGTVTRRGRIGHLAQEPSFPDSSQTLAAAFADGRPGDPDEHVERLLSLGLFDRTQLDTRVADLSTGQRQRLALARLVTEPVDALLLDEPTNHLSPALIEDLETALTSYRGALLVVSHDRRLRSRWQGARLDLGATARPSRGVSEWVTAPSSAPGSSAAIRRG
ncbi:ribosomal protection-like ABC-F family protein [Nocardia caishijiensis]|uniref:Macrolide transport system ATP-binding/permease protein n=1 Tax=Nocardia caishijiensis TaxID=184756 RepID=A0ABQ6YQT7_9NOCA|nr:ABC-F family ATP-binding cassette domain-containing protein [Nocardia caishijiensis]KAF0848123.1 macrolide transport system ATP-binding/permease protein [Nocardia caishijiensis]